MNTAIKTNGTGNKPCGGTPQGHKQAEAGKAKPRCLKLGIGVHWEQYTVVAQFDEAAPRLARRFTPQAFAEWVQTQLGESGEAHSCYGAGAFGYIAGTWSSFVTFYATTTS